MSDNREDERARLESFFQEVADVMDKHGEVAARFVLAEVQASSGDEVPSEFLASSSKEASDGMAPSARAVENMMEMRAASRKVCIRYGINPRTGRRVCIQEVEIG